MRGKISSWSGRVGRLIADDGGKYEFVRRDVCPDEYGVRQLVIGEPVEFVPNFNKELEIWWATEVLADRIDPNAEPAPGHREDMEITRFAPGGKIFFAKRFNGGDGVACLFANIISEHGELKQGTRIHAGIERHPEDRCKFRAHSIEVYQD